METMFSGFPSNVQAAAMIHRVSWWTDALHGDEVTTAA